MKTTNMQLKRLGGTLLAMALAAPAFVSAQNTLPGAWQSASTVNGMQCTLNLVMDSVSYSELAQCGPYMTKQSGTYVVSGSLMVRNVMDWEPKQQWVVDGRPLGYDYRCPNGRNTCPGYYGGPGGNYQRGPGGHWVATGRPPGGSFQVTFTSPNTMVWRDVNFGGTLTFQRVR